MSPVAHAIGILTFAIWLSVLGIGGTGFFPIGESAPHVAEKPLSTMEKLDAVLLTDDFTGPEEIPQEATEAGTTGDADEAAIPATLVETLPAPPEIPALVETTPLPSIPDLPAPEKSKPALKPVPRKASSDPRPAEKSGGKPAANSAARGTSGNGGQNGGSGMSDATRLGGGRMPSPTYPSSARRAGHEGTVTVEFIVGDGGSVISAYAKRASPWPELNEAAVSAVRRWRFPPGKTSKYVRPIIFKLN